MKRLTSALLLLQLTLSCFAQLRHVAESTPFEEPTTGYAKLIQLKNGNTMYLHMAPKEAIDVKLFDAQHKQKALKAVSPAYDQTKRATVKAVFELGGNVVVLIGDYDDRVPVLHRVVIDGNTGEKISSESLGELSKITFGQGYAMAFGAVPLPDFFVRKDPNSDNYAVLQLNSFESDRNKRMLIVWYGPDNKEINRAYYTSPKEKYKYLEYLDMAVIGGDQVSVLAFAHNTAAHGGKESELVIANLKANAKAVELDELPFSHDLIVRYGITRYNPVTRQLLLVAAVQAGRDRLKFGTVLCHIDPYARKILDNKTAYPSKANDESLSLFGRKHEFEGLPQNLFVNADGSFTIVYEEMAIKTSSYTSMGGMSTTSTYSNSILGNVAVSRYDAQGNEISSYMIPKSQEIIGGTNAVYEPFYLSARDGSATELHDGNQYKSFAYLDGKDKSFILFNDAEKNGESVQKGKLTTIVGVSDCDGYYFPLEGDGILPTRQFVFGQPSGKREHNLALFAVSDYDRDRDVYTTLQLVKDGRSKEVKVVWLQP
jgi:hypothetical protein